MSNGPSIAALLWCAGLALAGCSYNGPVVRDPHGWPLPTYALRSVPCYRVSGEGVVWWTSLARHDRRGVWTCGTIDDLGIARREPGVIPEPPPPEPPPPPTPSRPPSASAGGEPTLGAVR